MNLNLGFLCDAMNSLAAHFGDREVDPAFLKTMTATLLDLQTCYRSMPKVEKPKPRTEHRHAEA